MGGKRVVDVITTPCFFFVKVVIYLARRLPEYTITEEIYRNIKENPDMERIQAAKEILQNHKDIISEIPRRGKKSKRRE